MGDDDTGRMCELMDGTSSGLEAALEFIGRFISDGIASRRFTESEVQNDVDIALKIGYLCNEMDDYEHYCTSCEWLSRVESKGRGIGAWYHRYAKALMYTGRPRLAMEYLSRGVDEAPEYAENWMVLSRLRAHFGDMDGAMSAAERGFDLLRWDERSRDRAREDLAGKTLEEMEFLEVARMTGLEVRGPDDPLCSRDPEVARRAESVKGIVCDKDALESVKSAVGGIGWIPDHPYCTCMIQLDGAEVMLTFAMNEAYLSHMDPGRIASIVGSVRGLESAAREELTSRGGGRGMLYGVTIDRGMNTVLSFTSGGFKDEAPETVTFDGDGAIVRGNISGGPFVSFVLLADDGWDPADTRQALADAWDIHVPEDDAGGGLVFELEGCLAAVSLIRNPIPDGEAEESAANNYLWPEATRTVAGHRAHLIVALVNHSASAMDAARIWTMITAACCQSSNPLGVFIQGTVLEPSYYVREAEEMGRGSLPVNDWVWIGLYSTVEGTNGYTNGLSLFGEEEIEAVGVEGGPDDVRRLLHTLVLLVLSGEGGLRDGERIGFGDGYLVASRGPGISVDGVSIRLMRPDRRVV